MPVFISSPYSPWSERARFVLDHHRVDYTLVQHEPVIGELAWRARTGRWRGRASVPVWLDGETKLFDSFAIAKHVDRTGPSEKLLPPEHLDAITRWNDASERALASARKRSMARLLDDDEALAASLPPVAPGALRRRLVPVARSAVRFIQLKYGMSSIDVAAVETELDGLRAALAIGNGDYILGRFTYADVTMSSVIHMVSPLGEPFIRLDDHIRRYFADADLARKYADLVDWRNALYRRHGPARRRTR